MMSSVRSRLAPPCCQQLSTCRSPVLLPFASFSSPKLNQLVPQPSPSSSRLPYTVNRARTGHRRPWWSCKDIGRGLFRRYQVARGGISHSRSRPGAGMRQLERLCDGFEFRVIALARESLWLSETFSDGDIIAKICAQDG